MKDLGMFFKRLFFLIIFVFSINLSASAMHIYISVNNDDPEFLTFSLELKDGRKLIKNLYGEIYPLPTKAQTDLVNKINKKVIKEDNEFFSEILELSEKKKDLDANEHGKKYTAKKWKKENDYVKKRMIEILHSLEK